MLTQCIYLGSMPALGRLVAQYQVTVNCKCHPNYIENIANLTYDGGRFSAILLTTVCNSCIYDCNQCYGKDICN